MLWYYVLITFAHKGEKYIIKQTQNAQILSNYVSFFPNRHHSINYMDTTIFCVTTKPLYMNPIDHFCK